MSIEINNNYENYSTQINDNSANNVKRTNETTSKQVSVDEYKKTLMDKFSFLGKTTSMSGVPTTVSVSSKYLAKCANDPELAQKLEENLKAIPSSIGLLNSKVAMGAGSPVVTYANISVDANGNFSCVSGSTNDPDGKIAKENAERKKAEQKEKREEWEEKLAELRNKDKERWEELIAKSQNELYNSFEYNINGIDMNSIIQQITEKFDAGLFTNGKVFSYDVRVE